MFELEIMATGYAIVVASVTTVVCKLLSRKKLNQLREELNRAKASVSRSEVEVRNIKIKLDEMSKNG